MLLSAVHVGDVLHGFRQWWPGTVAAEAVELEHLFAGRHWLAANLAAGLFWCFAHGLSVLGLGIFQPSAFVAEFITKRVISRIVMAGCVCPIKQIIVRLSELGFWFHF